jgi:hypothetical protein
MARSRYADPAWWQLTADRAVKAAATAFLACIGTDLVGITDLDWWQDLNISAAAALVSVLADVAGRGPVDAER